MSLPFLYVNGKVVEKDYKKALGYIFKYLEIEDYLEIMKPSLYYFIGDVYAKGGYGIKSDYKQALNWLLKAGDNSESDSFSLAGLIYSEGGYGVEKDYYQGLLCFMKSAELSDLLKSGCAKDSTRNDDKHDYQEVHVWLKKAAGKNNANAQCAAGCYCYKGLGGVERNYVKAMQYFTKSAENGCAKVYANMGELHHYGYGVSIDYNQALRLYKQANGTGTALNGIGLLHQSGLGVPQNYSKSMKYFELSADKKCEVAFNSLGDIYYCGLDDVDQNYEKAFRYYSKSAEKQCDKGQFNLGSMHWKGESTEIEYNLAPHWMKKAAYNGNDKTHKYIEKISRMIPDSQNSTQIIKQSNSNDSIIDSDTSAFLAKFEEAEKEATAVDEKVALLIAQLESKNLESKSVNSHNSANLPSALENNNHQRKSEPKKFFHVEHQSFRLAATQATEKKKEPMKFFHIQDQSLRFLAATQIEEKKEELIKFFHL